MKSKLTILTVALMLVAVPLSTARHLSVGVQDSMMTGPEETPDAPSISQQAYQAGISTDCYSPSGNVSAEDVQTATQAEGFCGDLLYHEGTGLTHVSPPDQDLRSSQIGTFDVVTTRYVGSYTGTTCTPYCQNSFQGYGDLVFNGLHSAGDALGLMESPEDANQSENERSQRYSINLYYPGAGSQLQDEASPWAMDGWRTPGTGRAHVGYLEDNDGRPIGEDRLQDIVTQQAGNELPNDAAANVCGFTPNGDYTSSVTQGFCEVQFEYQEPEEDRENAFTDGYDDECGSPTYVCGNVAGPAWYRSVPCIASCAGLASQAQHMVWHFLVAPQPSACGGAQEPGASFQTPEGAEKPYLAHDLDVYTPVTDTRNGPGASMEGAQRYSGAVAGSAVGQGVEVVNQVFDEADDLVPTLPGVPPAVNEAVSDALNQTADETNTAISTAVNATFVPLKSHRVEPNNAEAVGSLNDTSQHLAQPDTDLDELRRTVDGGPCAALQGDETDQTVDPWVDIVDSEAWVFPGFAAGFFGNTDRNQDQHNNPTPGLYYTSGMVGMFTDKDDNGLYEQAGTDKYQGETIRGVGAYPMLWDMHVTPDGEVKENGGCSVLGEHLPKMMKDLGYGPETALVQALYLREPTVVTQIGTGQTVQYADGNNIILWMSQAAKQRYDPGATIPGIDAEIDQLVSNLKDYAVEKGAPSEPQVRLPGQELGLQSDYFGQCAESTGGFQSQMQVLHDCSLECQGDTIATMYTFELVKDELGGGKIPGFAVQDEPYAFGADQHTWYDIDPFDGDADRNSDDSSAPPS